MLYKVKWEKLTGKYENNLVAVGIYKKIMTKWWLKTNISTIGLGCKTCEVKSM